MSTQRLVRSLLVLVVAAGFLASAAAAERRWVVRVDEPFEVQGRMFASGTLVLEHRGDYTPSLALTELWVDGEFLGLLQVDRVANARAPERDTLSFARAPLGHLVLLGYGSPAHGLHGEFRLRGAGATDRATSTLVAVR